MDWQDIPPGSFVSHPHHGPCRVVGVRADPALGAALVLERCAPLTGRVLIAMGKLHKASLRALPAAEAQEQAASWQRPRGRFNHVPPDVQRARRVAEMRSFKKSLAGYAGARARWGGA